MRPCVVIPHFNHARQLSAVLDAIEPFGLPLILVDDGSAAAELAALKAVVAGRPWVQLHQEPRNQGKGAAVMRGLQLAAARGFTHAVQIDADGQHRVADIPVMLDICAAGTDGGGVGIARIRCFGAGCPAARPQDQHLLGARAHVVP